MNERQVLKVLDLLAEAIIDLAEGDADYTLREAQEARSILADLILHCTEVAPHE